MSDLMEPEPAPMGAPEDGQGARQGARQGAVRVRGLVRDGERPGGERTGDVRDNDRVTKTAKGANYRWPPQRPWSKVTNCPARDTVETVEDQEWRKLANCLGVDPDLFYPDRGASTREAKNVCRGCVVREECLEYALSTGEKFGIWGGLSERERRRIRRQRSIDLRRRGA